MARDFLPYSLRQSAPPTLLVAAAVTAVLTALCITLIDQPLARWIAQWDPIALWDQGIEVVEYASGFPISRLFSSLFVVGGMLVVACVPRLRGYAPAWMFVAATHLLSRLAMRYTKDWTGRLRPSEWLAHPDGPTFLTEKGISFPSGHVVQFASLLIPLAVLVPRARPALAIVGFVMLARLAVNAHFLADVMGAITLVSLVAWLCGWAIRPCAPTPPR